MADRAPNMIVITIAAVVGVGGLGAFFAVLAGDAPPSPPNAPESSRRTPTPTPDAATPFRLTMSPLTYVGQLSILEEAIEDGRAEFESCWTSTDGRDGTYRVKVRLESTRDTASVGAVEVDPAPGVDPYVCVSTLFHPRPGHDSFFDGTFTLTIRGRSSSISSISAN
jgi:hypothetical protein